MPLLIALGIGFGIAKLTDDSYLIKGTVVVVAGVYIYSKLRVA